MNLSPSRIPEISARRSINMSYINCGICAEERVYRGMSCPCSNDICIACQSKMDKCPFCRTKFPDIICRIANASSINEACRVYAEMFKDIKEKSETEYKVCNAIVKVLRKKNFDIQIFQHILDGFVQDNSQMYVRLIGYLEEELFESVREGDLEKFMDVGDLIHEYHHSESRLLSLMKAVMEQDEERVRLVKKNYQKAIYKERARAARRKQSTRKNHH